MSGKGWQPLFGSFHGAGYSIEWHDFFAKREFDWAASFHPGCVELCLNLDGHGFVECKHRRTDFAPNTVGFYHRKDEPLTAKRAANEQHQFLTVEFSVSVSGETSRRHGADAASGGARGDGKLPVRTGVRRDRAAHAPRSSSSSPRCGSRRCMPPRSRCGISARRWNWQ